MPIKNIDHVVFTVENPEKTAEFYQNIMGMTPERFGANQERLALKFGEQKLNLHPSAAPYKPHAAYPTAGGMDVCFITDTPLADAMAHVRKKGVTIEEGPVQRTGANGPIQSFYFRDPDGNLIEVANYPEIKAENFLDKIAKNSVSVQTWATGSAAVLGMERVLRHAPSRIRGLSSVAGLVTAVGFDLWRSHAPISKNTVLPSNTVRFK